MILMPRKEKTGKVFGRDLDGVELDWLPDDKISRIEVFELAAPKNRKKVNTVTICAAAMAWGGMRENHKRMFFKLADEGWLKVADDIRAGSLNRKDAYNEFAKLRKDKKLKGVGPAYFTKLIYFLTPRDREDVAQGYIMDQWAGCSINLLLNKECVLMKAAPSRKKGIKEPQHDFTVSDANTSGNYENFCKAVDELREIVGLCPDRIDCALVSIGGRNKLEWRKYVIDNRAASLFRRV